MAESRSYRIAGTKNTTLYANGWFSSHEEAISVARHFLDTWVHEGWVRVKVHEGPNHWSRVAIVHRHRVEHAHFG